MSAVRVHCPAHITLLFSIHDTDNRSSHQGSRGAGFCVEAGVSVTAEISEQSSKEDGVDVSSQVKVWDRVESLIDHERESSFYSMYHDIAEHFRDSGCIDESESVNLEGLLRHGARPRRRSPSLTWPSCPHSGRAPAKRGRKRGISGAIAEKS